MTCQSAAFNDDQNTLPNLPPWVTSGQTETLETVAFRSGAVLLVLEQLISDPRHGVPVKLLANRLALNAATATSKLEGRLAREVDIRDAYHLTPAGVARGPDGDLLAFWRDAVQVQLASKKRQTLAKTLPGGELSAEAFEGLRLGMKRATSHGPLAGCIVAMTEVLKADDRAERFACLLSDSVLASALKWNRLLPVTSRHLNKAMLRKLLAGEPGADLAISSIVLASLEDIVRMARELAKRAGALRAIAPKLRSKGADAAVALFLSEDAVAPSTMLSPLIRGTDIPMTDRAARRFCDRLVALGVAQELTGRSTFRLYGLAP